MKGFRTRLQGAPLGVMFAWFTGFYFVFTYAFALLDGSARLTLVDALIRLVGAAFFGAAMTALTAWRRRQNGGVGTLLQINKALKTGQVPEEAEPAIWIPALELRHRQSARARWLNPVIFGLFTALSIWLGTQEPASFLPWIGAVFFVTVAILSAVQARRALTKTELLLAQLQAAPVAPPRW